MTAARFAWKCPTCGRRFARARQAHSCQVVPLSAHRAKAPPEVRRIYDAVVAFLRTCGPLDAVPTKSGINLLSRTSLGGIHLQKSKARLGLVMTRRVRSPRIQRVLQISPRSFVHYIDVATVAEVDKELKSWLAAAHEVGMMAGRRV